MHTADWIQLICGIVMIPLGVFVLRKRVKFAIWYTQFNRAIFANGVLPAEARLTRFKIVFAGYAVVIIGVLFIVRSLFFYWLFQTPA